eukprot:4785479-Prymnesium_polylepis.1
MSRESPGVTNADAVSSCSFSRPIESCTLATSVGALAVLIACCSSWQRMSDSRGHRLLSPLAASGSRSRSSMASLRCASGPSAAAASTRFLVRAPTLPNESLFAPPASTRLRRSSSSCAARRCLWPVTIIEFMSASALASTHISRRSSNQPSSAKI